MWTVDGTSFRTVFTEDAACDVVELANRRGNAASIVENVSAADPSSGERVLFIGSPFVVLES